MNDKLKYLVLICKKGFRIANTFLRNTMRTLKTRESNLETEEYAVQDARLFRKFETPRFGAKPYDVNRHQSEASMGFFDFCQMFFYSSWMATI